MPRRSPEQQRQRAEADARIAAFIDRKYALILAPVVEAARRYQARLIDWGEFDSVIHGYTIVTKDLWSFLQQPRAELLRLALAEDRGEEQWDPIHALALDQHHQRLPHKLRDLSATTLGDAVASLTKAAGDANRTTLVRTPAAWSELVLRHMPTLDISGFLEEALGDGASDSADELDRWLALLQNIWNTTPIADLGGRPPC